MATPGYGWYTVPGYPTPLELTADHAARIGATPVAGTPATGVPFPASAVRYDGGSGLPAGPVETAIDLLDGRRNPAVAPAGHFDTIRSSGVYYVPWQADLPGTRGAPSGSEGYLEVARYDGTGPHITQTYTATTTGDGRTYTRFSNNGGTSWSPWRVLVRVGDANAGGVITGAGQPEGNVSAPIGTCYVNTEANGWNGVRAWRKTAGTGNTGWTVSEGDTGWRDLPDTALHADWVKASVAPFLRVRRVNNLVSLEARLGPAATKVGTGRGPATTLLTLPAGFPPTLGYVVRTLACVNTTPCGAVGHLASLAAIGYYHNPALLAGQWATNDVLSFGATWVADAPWPVLT